MIERTKFRWKIVARRVDDDQLVHFDFDTYWAPGSVESADVAVGALAQMQRQTGQAFQPISAEPAGIVA